MSLTIIIPAKPFGEAKTRLAAILSPAQRADLSRTLLSQTLNVAREIAPVLVVSRSQSVLRLARRAGAEGLVEAEPTLNAAVRQGIAWAMKRQAAQVLILLADLPLLTPTDLHSLIPASQPNRPEVVIAPCRRSQGTNALFLSPPDIIQPQFGLHSFAIHHGLTKQAGASIRIHRAPNLAFDLDTAEDWQDYLAVTPTFSLIDPTSRLPH